MTNVFKEAAVRSGLKEASRALNGVVYTLTDSDDIGDDIFEYAVAAKLAVFKAQRALEKRQRERLNESERTERSVPS